MRTRGGYRWFKDGLDSGCGAFGVCVCEARQRNLRDSVVLFAEGVGRPAGASGAVCEAPAAGDTSSRHRNAAMKIRGISTTLPTGTGRSRCCVPRYVPQICPPPVTRTSSRAREEAETKIDPTRSSRNIHEVPICDSSRRGWQKITRRQVDGPRGGNDLTTF